ncbi:MAG: 16S rRNA (cytosine(967)-C(5))-methyltransferase RsmB [Deltaproteobacteria bacterium]|nr:16S rRNA (cytosine(967)-C(5))-methyltransferase RsmB [Deltaproteobacteria bacterium]
MDISTEPRLLAGEILSRVEKHNAYANIAFDAVAHRGGISRDVKALAKELIFGVLRNQSRLERAVSAYIKYPLSHTQPFVRRQLIIAAYQLLFLDSIPDYAVVDKAVEIIRVSMGTSPSGFANAVLRKIVNEGEPSFPSFENSPREFISQFYSYPDWIVDIFIKSVGIENASSLAESLNSRARTIIRTNIIKNSRNELSEMISRDFPDLEKSFTKYSPYGIEVRNMGDPIRQKLHREGNYLIQDEGSQLVSLFVDPQKGEKILDACAGTGGKSLHMAALTGNESEILAVDSKASKMDALRQRAVRTGCTRIRTTPMDLTLGYPDELFDRILLDSPCSGLGVLRRHPEAKWRLKREDINDLVVTQQKLLENVSSLVKPGGTLIYTVCTFNNEETTDQIEKFLLNHKNFELAPKPENSIVNWDGITTNEGYLRLYTHLHDCDGFFGARLIRKS